MAYDPAYDPKQILVFGEQEILHGVSSKGKPLRDIINELLFIEYDKRGSKSKLSNKKTPRTRSYKYTIKYPHQKFQYIDSSGIEHFSELPEEEDIMTEADYIDTEDSESDIDEEDIILGYTRKKVGSKFDTFCRKIVDKKYTKEIIFNEDSGVNYTHIYFLLDIDISKELKGGSRKLKIQTRKKGKNKKINTRKNKAITMRKNKRNNMKKNKSYNIHLRQKGGTIFNLKERIDLLERSKIRGYMITNEKPTFFKVLTICSAQHSSLTLRSSAYIKKGYGKFLMQFIINKMNNNSRIKYIYLDALIEAVPYYTRYGFILLPYGENIARIKPDKYLKLLNEQKGKVKDIIKTKNKDDIKNLFGYYLKCGDSTPETRHYYSDCIDDGFVMVLYPNKVLGI